MIPPRSDFPAGFLFGAATSAYQIEGRGDPRHGGAGRCHWDDFAATPGNVSGAEDGRVACDHLTRWAGDLDLVAGLGADIYRFSCNWARVIPEGRGAPNPAGLDFYDRLVDGMLARGLKPACTLYHWDLPSPLADLGGWRNRDIAGWLADYAEALIARIGDRLWSVAPVNEPWCVSWLSHFEGAHAPGLRDIRATARAMHHVLLAHGTTIAALRALGQQNLGAVCNFEPALPADDSPEAAAAADRRDAIYNRFFVQGMMRASYPEAALEGLGPHLPKGWEADMPTIAAPLDWFGVNYYTSARIAPAPGPWPALRQAPPHPPTTAMGWEIRPEGLTEVLTWLARKETGSLPLHVTENGMAARSGLADEDRIAYFAAHLGAVRTALSQGAPVAGYYAWSLLDNYEWAEGYDKRFGLVEVDFTTQARRPKSSYRALAAAWAR